MLFSVELYQDTPILIHIIRIDESAKDQLYDLYVINKERYQLKLGEEEIYTAALGDTLTLPWITMKVEVNHKLLEEKNYSCCSYLSSVDLCGFPTHE